MREPLSVGIERMRGSLEDLAAMAMACRASCSSLPTNWVEPSTTICGV